MRKPKHVVPETASPLLGKPYNSVVRDEATIEANADKLFDFLYDPRSSVLLVPDCEVASSLEGTGPGVGEIQVMVNRQPGSVRRFIQALQVEVFEPPRYVRFSTLRQPGLVAEDCELSFHPLGPTVTRLGYVTSVACAATARRDEVIRIEHERATFLKSYLNAVARHARAI